MHMTCPYDRVMRIMTVQLTCPMSLTSYNPKKHTDVLRTSEMVR